MIEGISQDAKDFLKLCLNRDKSSRPKCEELLEHNWIKERDHDFTESLIPEGEEVDDSGYQVL